MQKCEKGDDLKHMINTCLLLSTVVKLDFPALFSSNLKINMSGLRKIPIFIADAFSPVPFGKKTILIL